MGLRILATMDMSQWSVVLLVKITHQLSHNSINFSFMTNHLMRDTLYQMIANLAIRIKKNQPTHTSINASLAAMKVPVLMITQVSVGE